MSFTCKEPKLRFPEFRGQWIHEPIGNHINLFSGFPFEGRDISEDITGVPLLRGINITEGYIRHSKEIDRFFLGNIENLNKYLLESGDLVLGMDGSKVGKNVALVSKKDSGSLLIQRVARLRPKHDSDIKFIYQHIRSNKFHRYVDIVNTSSGIPHISAQQIKDFKIYFPKYQEQEKIASFLTEVDAKIEQLTCKEKLLEKYKKSAMQKLFSQELRFTCNDGSEYSEWEEKKLGEVSEIIMGQSPDSSSYNSDEIGTPLIQGNADIQNRVSNPRNWTTQVTKECKIDDLILTVRAPVGAIAKSMHNACIGRGVCAIRNNAKSNIEFLFQFLLNFESKWGSLEQGSTFTAVSGNEIKNLKINLPSLPEQTKIANFLSAIDEKCLHVKHQLEQTRQFKKALLQQMFV